MGNHRVLLLRDGSPAKVIGREGSGPGEFRNPSDLHALGPSGVFIWDRGLLRSTRLTAGGSTAGTQLVHATIRGLDIKNALPSLRGMLAVFDRSADALNPPAGGQASRGVLVHLSFDSDRFDTLATFPLSGPVVVRESGSAGGFAMHVFTPPFDAAPHADATPACGGVAAVSVGGRGFQIRFFGRNGNDLGTLEQPVVGRKISDEERARYFAQFTGESRRLVEQAITVPERHPAVHAVRLTSGGHLWVRLTPGSVVGAEEQATWRVWPIERVEERVRLGEPIEVRLPPRLSVQDVRGGGELWGFEYDELDVPRVRAYRLPDEFRGACGSESLEQPGLSATEPSDRQIGRGRETPTHAGRPANTDRPRDALIAAAYSAATNPTMAEVGAQFGISRERVRQCIDRWEKETGQRLTRSASRRRVARLAAIEESRVAPPCLEQVLLDRVKTDPVTGCWGWVGRTHRAGDGEYPVVRFGGKEELANRVAYELWCGELTPSELVLATCGAACINPAHLRKLSRAEYMRTRVRTSQPRLAHSHCKQGHPLTPDNVYWNPGWRVRNGERVRVRTRLCKICNGARQARSTGKPKPSPLPPPPPLPDDPHERALAVAVRRIVNARKSRRAGVFDRQISLYGTLWDRELGPPTVGEESYVDYHRRTLAGPPSWFTWRLALSETVAVSCATVPTLQDLIQRVERRAA